MKHLLSALLLCVGVVLLLLPFLPPPTLFTHGCANPDCMYQYAEKPVVVTQRSLEGVTVVDANGVEWSYRKGWQVTNYIILNHEVGDTITLTQAEILNESN